MGGDFAVGEAFAEEDIGKITDTSCILFGTLPLGVE